MGTLPSQSLKVKAAAAASRDSRKVSEGDTFILPMLIQLAAFYIPFSRRHILLGRPEVPDVNFNLGSVIQRDQKKAENYDGSCCSQTNTIYFTRKRPCVLALKVRFTVCGRPSNRSPAQACHFCSESFRMETHIKALSQSF